MLTKSELLNNLREYTADQIVEAIEAGTVTLYELSKSGNLTPRMRQRVEERLAARPIEASPSAQEVNPTVEGAPVFNLDKDLSEDVEPSNQEASAPSNRGMFKRPFSFKGRIRRTEYCLSYLIYYIWCVVVDAMMETPDPSLGASVFVLISYIPMIWFLWAQGAKRCHDRGASGWYQLLPFYVLVLFFRRSDDGSNKYGDNPKIKP